MTYRSKNNPEKKYGWHILYWIVLYLLYITQYMFTERTDSQRHQFSFYDRTITTFFHVLAIMSASYFCYLRILPLLIDKKKMIRGIIECAVGIYIIAVVSRFSIIYLLEPMLGGNFGAKESVWEIFIALPTLFTHYIISIVSGTLPFIIVYLLIDRQRIIIQQSEIENEKINAQLEALKAQINPHFLFNTLNNIYSLAVQQSPKTADTIDKLAQLLDYLLYRCNNNHVSLENEIHFLQSYLDLGKTRFSERLSIQFIHKSDMAYQIAPLLLIPIIENMFKHGAEQTVGTIAFNINLKAENNQLTLIATNNYNNTENKTSGIGLTNLKQRLQMLYPGKHALTINTSNPEIFEVKLQVPLI